MYHNIVTLDTFPFGDVHEQGLAEGVILVSDSTSLPNGDVRKRLYYSCPGLAMPLPKQFQCHEAQIIYFFKKYKQLNGNTSTKKEKIQTKMLNTKEPSSLF